MVYLRLLKRTANAASTAITTMAAIATYTGVFAFCVGGWTADVGEVAGEGEVVCWGVKVAVGAAVLVGIAAAG